MLKAGPSMLGSDEQDANRRRERGAKALEERLGSKAAGGGGAGDVEAGGGSMPPVSSGETPSAAGK